MERRTNDMDMARKLAELVRQKGGCAYFVGGFVRDRMLGHITKDIDIEIHGLSPSELSDILDSLGERVSVGESFGIFMLKGFSLDIAMPRREALRGIGHKDFDIIVDPFIGTEAAARRRDFTVNAMMQDILSGRLIDHFGGAEDLRCGILRHVDSCSFAEDPLRVLRGAQFAARFSLIPDEATLKLCRSMDLSHLARERVTAELEKALLSAPRPSVFFECLREMEQLSVWFAELEALVGVRQNPVYHAEGDAWAHTMLVLDKAAGLKERSRCPLWFMYSALCHDIGKAAYTTEKDGIIHAYGHEKAGLPIAEAFLRRISSETGLIKYVLNMIELHMLPVTAAVRGSSIKSTNRMFDRSVDPSALIALGLADDRGRISSLPLPDSEPFLLERLDIYREYMSRPYVMGKDLIAAGLSPSKNFGELLAYAHKLRLAGTEKSSALKQTLSYARKLDKKS